MKRLTAKEYLTVADQILRLSPREKSDMSAKNVTNLNLDDYCGDCNDLTTTGVDCARCSMLGELR